VRDVPISDIQNYIMIHEIPNSYFLIFYSSKPASLSQN